MVAPFFSVISAQQLNTQADEEKVKLSGTYYWEEVNANTKEKAINLANENLVLMILRNINIIGKMHEIKSIHLVGIDYLIFKRGPKFRVTAFIDTTSVIKQLKSLRELGYFEVVSSNKIENKSNNVIGNNVGINSSDSTNNKNLIKKEKNVDFKINISKNKDNDRLEKNKIEQQKGNSIPSGRIDTFYNNIITEKIKDVKNSDELFELLNKYKNNGRLVFGKKEVFSNPNSCDVLIFNPTTDKIIAYLMPKDKIFYNYLSQTMVTDYQTTFKDMIAIWIMYIEKK